MARISAVSESDAVSPGDVLILPVFADGRLPETSRTLGEKFHVDLCGGAIRFALKELGDSCWLTTGEAGGPSDVLLMCLGSCDDGRVSSAELRTATLRAARVAARERVSCTFATLPVSDGDASAVVSEAFVIGSYAYTRFLRQPRGLAIESVALLGADPGGVERGQLIGETVNFARDLTNAPGGSLTPEVFADIARAEGDEHGFTVRVIDQAALIDGGFGGIAGVGAGSDNPPVLIELSLGSRSGGHTALVGKGITFDTGGLDLKTVQNMLTMKDDMAGAAAVLGAFVAAGRLGYDGNLRGYLACAENMPSGRALRPGDVLTHRNGLTSEIMSPDCEGRLVLGDALAYAAEAGPDRIIDIATLTGSTSLGRDLWAVIGTGPQLSAELLRAGLRAGEPGWELPLWLGYKDAIKSEIADLKNYQYGIDWTYGAILGALYLREFVGAIPWAHVDIGATTFRDSPDSAWAAGATGNGTGTLIRYLFD